METSALRIFKEVAEQGSVSRAAQKLNYVQSNVTTRIKQLEEELDTQLFYRKPRGMSLTPAGETLLDYADRVLRLLDEAQMAVGERGEARGRLQIGSPNSVASYRLPALLVAYNRAYPQVEVSLHVEHDSELAGMVLDYKLDGSFVIGEVVHPELTQVRVFEEELVLVTQKGAPQPDQSPPRTLLACLFKSCEYRRRLDQLLQQRGQASYSVMEFHSMDGILGCVAAGMGASLQPRAAVEASPYAGNLDTYPVEEDFARVPIMFILRKDTQVSKALQGLLDLLPPDA